jgi:hypothetical protein
MVFPTKKLLKASLMIPSLFDCLLVYAFNQG